MPSTSHMDLLQNGGLTPRINGGGSSNTPKTGKAAKSGKNVNLSTQQLKVAHQRVNIDVDLAQRKIDGFTELTIVPTSNTLKTISLDCREMNIKDVYVNNIRHANYIYKDNLYINDDTVFEECIENQTINIFDLYSRDLNIHQHHLIRQKLNHVFGEVNFDSRDPFEKHLNGNTEELIIILPDNMKFELTDINSLHTPGSEAANTLTPLHLKSKSTSNEVYSPIQVLIEYECINSKNGVNFLTNDKTDKKFWHAYTVNSEYNISTSSWVPCIDNLWERSTWTIEINIPRTVKDIGNPRVIGSKEEIKSRKKRKASSVDGELEEEDEDEDDADYELSICTGDFNNVKETPHSIDLSKKVVSWSIFNPVCAHHVGWALGCFQTITLSKPAQDITDDIENELEPGNFDDIEKDNANSPVTIYCLPDQQELAENTCVFANRAMEYFSNEFGSFPFSSFAIAFVSGCVSETNNFAGLAIVNDKLLYPADIVEPMFTVTETLLESITTQWSGINIVPQTFNDFWCTIGIARYIAYQFIRELMGVNEYRYKIKQKMNKIVEEDINKKPLGNYFFRFPISDLDLDFIKLKSPIVLFILDRRMTKTDKSFGLSRVLPKLFLQAMSGDLQNGTLSTSHFQYVCEKVNRNKLDIFFRQWILGAGVPIFNITQSFNKKRSMIEMSIRQVQHSETKKPHPNPQTFINDSISYLDDEPSFPIQPVFLGPMTIRVHEADGTPYEHIVDLKEGVVRLDIQYNSKFKRLKKNKEDNNEPNSNFSKLGDVLMSSQEIQEWNLSDWARHEDEVLYNDPFEWIRVDTDFEWIAKINVKQPDYMFGAQLQYDRDVEAQYDAVSYFGDIEKPNPIYCSILTRTLMDKRYFYGIRIAAAQALASFSRPDNRFIGIEYLLKVYQKLFCFPNSFVPSSNDFNDFNNFFLQKEIPKILSDVRDDDGNVPQEIRTLLLNIVKYNDNSNNDFQDCFYLSELIKALANSALNTSGELQVDNPLTYAESEDNNSTSKDKFLELAVSEMSRLQKLDEWIPSYQNIISLTCLQQKIVLATHGKIQLTFEDLLYYTLEKYPVEIRVAAFRGILILGGLKNRDILQYFLKVCLLDFSDHTLRNKLIDAFINSICIAAIDGTPSTLDDPEFKTLEKLMEAGSRMTTNQTNMVIVEDTSNAEINSRRDAFARETLNGAIELLRRDYSIGQGLKNTFWELIHSSLLSVYERRNIFSICQILYKEIDSFVVRVPVPSVALNELKKKIVLKNVGGGKVVIKREGRFKIQLSSFKSNNEKNSEKAKAPQEPSPIKPATEPKLKIKLSSGAEPSEKKVTKKPEAKKPEVKKPEAKKPEAKKPEVAVTKKAEKEPQLVVADPKNKYKLTFKFKKRSLPAEPDVFEIPKPSPKKSNSKITFKFTNKKNREIIRDILVPKNEVPRYVKILTKEKKVLVSAQPFPESKDSAVSEETPNETPIIDDTSNGGEAISSINNAKDESQKASSVKNSDDTTTDEKLSENKRKIKLNFSKNPPTNNMKSITTPNGSRPPSRPPSRSASVEPEAKLETKPFERAASPFSKSSSPFSSNQGTKKKKTKIYIHPGEEKSRSSTPPEENIKKEQTSLAETESGRDTQEKNDESSRKNSDDSRPKPAFKLKLNLK